MTSFLLVAAFLVIVVATIWSFYDYNIRDRR